jgi:hypothetical protein
MLTVKHCALKEENAHGVVLPHHTDHGLGEGANLIKADLLRPVTIGMVMLCANAAAVIGPLPALQGLPCVHWLLFWRKAPFSEYRILVE